MVGSCRTWWFLSKSLGKLGKPWKIYGFFMNYEWWIFMNFSVGAPVSDIIFIHDSCRTRLDTTKTDSSRLVPNSTPSSKGLAFLPWNCEQNVIHAVLFLLRPLSLHLEFTRIMRRSEDLYHFPFHHGEAPIQRTSSSPSTWVPDEGYFLFGYDNPECWHLPTGSLHKSASVGRPVCLLFLESFLSRWAYPWWALGLRCILQEVARTDQAALCQTAWCTSWMSACSVLPDSCRQIVDHGKSSHCSSWYKAGNRSVERAARHAILDPLPSWATVELPHHISEHCQYVPDPLPSSLTVGPLHHILGCH